MDTNDINKTIEASLSLEQFYCIIEYWFENNPEFENTQIAGIKILSDGLEVSFAVYDWDYDSSNKKLWYIDKMDSLFLSKEQLIKIIKGE